MHENVKGREEVGLVRISNLRSIPQDHGSTRRQRSKHTLLRQLCGPIVAAAVCSATKPIYPDVHRLAIQSTQSNRFICILP